MPDPTLEEAITFAIGYIRSGLGRKGIIRDYGYDVWAPNVSMDWVFRHGQRRDEGQARQLSPIFYEALWELCRRGILRPGVRESQGQGVDDGGGYSVTIKGKEWLSNLDDTALLLLQPGSLGAAFTRYRERFGNGYYQRTQEAIKCRSAEAWLAACAMVGAAAESILLALAIAKLADEDEVLKRYRAKSGRQNLLNLLIGQQADAIARPFRSGIQLLAYWRDNAAHGHASPISTAETDQALRELLIFSQFSSDNWVTLTSPEGSASEQPN
ncbi:MAG: hypothetical protein ACLP7P_18545 [Rhodomicrobium sp.]